jgi:hypothetical protein
MLWNAVLVAALRHPPMFSLKTSVDLRKTDLDDRATVLEYLVPPPLPPTRPHLLAR